MKRHSVIPDVVDTAPKYKINVKYSNGIRVNMGNELTVRQTKNAPVQISWPYEPNVLYSLFMVDPDAPSRQKPVNAQWLHWSVVNIKNNTLSGGKVLMSYRGPSPPSGTGLHRYVFLVYKEKPTSQSDFAPIESRSKFNVTEYVKANNIGEFIGVNFFQVKRN